MLILKTSCRLYAVPLFKRVRMCVRPRLSGTVSLCLLFLRHSWWARAQCILTHCVCISLSKELKEQQPLKLAALIRERDRERRAYEDILAELSSLDRVAGVKELHKKMLHLLADLKRCKEQERLREEAMDKENEQPNSISPTTSDEMIRERQRALAALPSWTVPPALPRKSKHQQPQRLATRPVRTRHGSAYDSEAECRVGDAGLPRATGGATYSGSLTSQGISQRGYNSAPSSPRGGQRVRYVRYPNQRSLAPS